MCAFLEWIESGTPLIQLSTEKHTTPTLCNCNFTLQRQYFETFVHRNPLIRDEILFLAIFRADDQVYFLRYKHANSATIFLFWHAGLFTRSDLDRNSCDYNLRTFEFKHFGITWIRLLKAVELHAACMPVGLLLPQGVITTFCYDIDLFVSICQLYYIHKFLFLFIIFTLYWTNLNYFIQFTKVISLCEIRRK